MTTRRPPGKWEPWAAGFLMVLYGAGATQEGGPENALVNDMFLIGSVIWFISIAYRRWKFRNDPLAQVVTRQSTATSFPPPVVSTDAPPTPPPSSPPDATQQPAPATTTTHAEIRAMSENAAERDWSSRHGTLTLDNETLRFRSNGAGHKGFEYQVSKIRSAELNGFPLTRWTWLVVEVAGSGPVRFKIQTVESKAFLRKVKEAMAASQQNR